MPVKTHASIKFIMSPSWKQSVGRLVICGPWSKHHPSIVFIVYRALMSSWKSVFNSYYQKKQAYISNNSIQSSPKSRQKWKYKHSFNITLKLKPKMQRIIQTRDLLVLTLTMFLFGNVFNLPGPVSSP